MSKEKNKLIQLENGNLISFDEIKDIKYSEESNTIEITLKSY